MKKLIIVFCFLLLLAVGYTQLRVTNAYAVREKINPTDTSVSWDLWCWKEHPHHWITKSFIGHFEVQGNAVIGNKVTTSLCSR